MQRFSVSLTSLCLSVDESEGDMLWRAGHWGVPVDPHTASTTLCTSTEGTSIRGTLGVLQETGFNFKFFTFYLSWSPDLRQTCHVCSWLTYIVGGYSLQLFFANHYKLQDIRSSLTINSLWKLASFWQNFVIPKVCPIVFIPLGSMICNFNFLQSFG